MDNLEVFEKKVYDKFNLVADPRTDDWFLVRNWWPTISISILYLVTIKLLMKWMVKRPAFNLSLFMVFYNVALVILSAYLFVAYAYYGWRNGMRLTCWGPNPEVNSDTLGLADTFWWYYFSKIIELMDTVFFILRKKFDLVTVLHTYHHSIMPIVTWLPVRFGPGGFLSVAFMTNSFVHIFMYTYYALAAAGPKYRKYLFWKQYMTMLQIVQFIFVIFHCLYIFRIECNVPKVFALITISNGTIFLILFSHFYRISYSAKQKITKSE